ncbi:MAG: FKBP-type peptidyl-prolyl cis-trans isomerase [Desulfurococcaceae archaeon]
MPINKGEFVLIEYTIRVKETGLLLDTTDLELAKKENIYDPEKIYGPILVVIGRNWINSYVEQELAKMEIGEEKIIEVPPDKAFGERDPNKIKTFSLREFKRKGYNVNVGDVIEMGGAQGVIKSINGGRVIVDFNHPLAGKSLVYKVKVVKKLESFDEKIKALVTRHLGIPPDEIGIDYNEDKKTLILKMPGKYLSRRNLGYAKIALASDIFDLVKEQVDVLIYHEELRRPGS